MARSTASFASGEPSVATTISFMAGSSRVLLLDRSVPRDVSRVIRATPPPGRGFPAGRRAAGTQRVTTDTVGAVPLLAIALVIVAVNTLPAFAPPTWAILVFV